MDTILAVFYIDVLVATGFFFSRITKTKKLFESLYLTFVFSIVWPVLLGMWLSDNIDN